MPSEPENPVTKEGALLGRYLFYDPALSADNTFSCSSCHTQKAAFSDAPKQFSKGINGVLQTRNTLPLFNLAWYTGFFWDGRAATIESQVFHPLSGMNEMRISWTLAINRLRKSGHYKQLFIDAFGSNEIDSLRIVNAIAQFERTLISANSKYDKALRGEAFFTEDELEGFGLVNDMTKGDCLHCHSSDADALGTTGSFSNNGLDTNIVSEKADRGLAVFTNKKEDLGKFKIPSFRNLLFTAPYMHDGRFQTLEEVIDFYSEGIHNAANVDPRMSTVSRGGARLTKEEKRQIISFLKTMSDSSFITEPAFSNPFLLKD